MAGLNIYKVSFVDNFSTEFRTKKDLSLEQLKQEIEKISSIEVRQINKLEESQKFNVVQPKDIYFTIEYDYEGYPIFNNRILIPKIKDSITYLNVEEKMRDFANFVYGTDSRVPVIKFS